jgi:hypothetical protein
MAKPLPRIDGTEVVQQPRAQVQKQLENPPASERYSQTLIYASTLSIKRMPKTHRDAFCDIIQRLQNNGARLQDGTAVTDKTKAFLWMIENTSK